MSVPSEGLFRDQPKSYQESVLPAGLPRYGMTSGLEVNLRGLVGDAGTIHGLNHFGYSAPLQGPRREVRLQRRDRGGRSEEDAGAVVLAHLDMNDESHRFRGGFFVLRTRARSAGGVSWPVRMPVRGDGNRARTRSAGFPFSRKTAAGFCGSGKNAYLCPPVCRAGECGKIWTACNHNKKSLKQHVFLFQQPIFPILYV